MPYIMWLKRWGHHRRTKPDGSAKKKERKPTSATAAAPIAGNPLPRLPQSDPRRRARRRARHCRHRRHRRSEGATFDGLERKAGIA